MIKKNMKKYSESFKMSSVKALRTMKRLGIIRINKIEVKNVRELVKALDISTDSLYNWNKLYSKKKLKDIIVPGELEIENLDVNLDKVSIIPGEKSVFGLRFWGFVAKWMKIKNYARLDLNGLKKAVGKALLEGEIIPDTSIIVEKETKSIKKPKKKVKEKLSKEQIANKHDSLAERMDRLISGYPNTSFNEILSLFEVEKDSFKANNLKNLYKQALSGN